MKKKRGIKGYPVFWYVDSLSKLIFEPVVTATGFFLAINGLKVENIFQCSSGSRHKSLTV
jgi:hypothetical protein